MINTRLLLLSAFLLGIVSCSPNTRRNFSDDELALALTEISAERTQAADAKPVLEPSATIGAAEEIATATPIAAIVPDAPHGDGTYLVGAEISPGRWRSTAEGQRFCYWARRKYDGILLGSYYGLPGIELRIFANDYEVELDGCGTWVFIDAN